MRHATAFKPTPEMIEAARNVFLAMAHLQLVQPVVEAYSKAILASKRYCVAPEFRGRRSTSLDHDEVIVDPELSYLMSDQDFQEYDSLMKQERDRHKLRVSNPDFCPLLEAKHIKMQAERCMVNSLESITGLNWNTLLCLGLEKKKQFIELSLKLMAPHVGDAKANLDRLGSVPG